MLKYQLKNVSLKTAIVQKKYVWGVANYNIKTALIGLTHLFLLSSVMAAEDLMGLN